jgi:hypothetical protein
MMIYLFVQATLGADDAGNPDWRALDRAEAWRQVHHGPPRRAVSWRTSEVKPKNLEAWCAARTIIKSGITPHQKSTVKLRGQPVFESFDGPFLDLLPDGTSSIRYENHLAVEILSS